MMKFFGYILAAAALISCLSVPALAADAPEISAKSAIVTEAETGRALYEKNADEPMLIASTTKIMTALIVIERCDLDEVVTADPAWTGIEGSSMYLKPGQTLTVRELLYGLMLASGNDAAVALACIAAGSVEAFAGLMNERAAGLGCENTHFENPNGLDGEAHHASARDLARITREAIKNEDFRQIVSCTAKTVGDQTYTNHNRLLRECEGVFGVKTGYTEAAGRTLVTCCERGGATLICVTLSDPNDWIDHAGLYDWAYAAYAREEAVAGDSAWIVPVVGGTEAEVTVSPQEPLYVLYGEDETVTVELRLPRFVYADVAAGEEAGSLTAYVDGVEAGSVELVFDRDVEKEQAETVSAWERLREIFGLGERKIYTLS